MAKRDRSTNFTLEETDLLLSLVEKNCDIIECKQSDSLTWKQKFDAWEAISLQINSMIGGGRDAKHLKMKYEALKKKIKRDNANIKVEVFRTGGGSSKVIRKDIFHDRVMALAGLSATGLTSRFDNDAEDRGAVECSLNNLVDDDAFEHSKPEAEAVGDHSKIMSQEIHCSGSFSFSPGSLRRPLHVALRSPTETSLSGTSSVTQSQTQSVTEEGPADPGSSPKNMSVPIVTPRRLKRQRRPTQDNNKEVQQLYEAKRRLVELQIKVTEQEWEENRQRNAEETEENKRDREWKRKMEEEEWEDRMRKRARDEEEHQLRMEILELEKASLNVQFEN